MRANARERVFRRRHLGIFPLRESGRGYVMLTSV